jgi:hypothetical protein
MSHSHAIRRRSALNISQVEGLLLWGWLGGYKYEGGDAKCGRLLTIEELGEILHSTSTHHVGPWGTS